VQKPIPPKIPNNPAFGLSRRVLGQLKAEMNRRYLMTQAELMQELEILKAQNEILKAKLTQKKPGVLTCKVSAKGAVSVYGLGRFPVTLYSEQWQRLLDKGEEIRAFISANIDSLATKAAA
jgi:hypothetical protein